MKDASKLLNFNTDRDLGFKVFRDIDFKVRRQLAFDLDRDLFFDLDRDLGFGKRGVVFRGYVCPICGAPVAKDAADCDECGVKFKGSLDKSSGKGQRERKRTWSRGERENIQTEKTADKMKFKETFQCPVCGKILYTGVSRCSGCDVVFETDGPPGSSTLPEGFVPCAYCNYMIPPRDKYCRRCGSVRPGEKDSVTVDWEEHKASQKDDSLVTWEEYSARN